MGQSRLPQDLRDVCLCDYHVPFCSDGVCVSLCSDRDKEKVRNFAFRMEQSDRYGIRDHSLYRNEYWDYTQFEYIVARCPASQEILGDLRLRLDYDTSQFTNLLPDFKRHVQNHPVIDIGGHIDRPAGQRHGIFTRMWAYLVRTLRGTPFNTLYGQVRTTMVREYMTMGWRVCTTKFSAAAWWNEWIGIWYCLDDINDSWFTKEYSREWADRYGVRLNRKFLKHVCNIVDDSTYWSGTSGSH